MLNDRNGFLLHASVVDILKKIDLGGRKNILNL